MKSASKFLVLLLLLAACGKSTQTEQPDGDNPNQDLYNQVMAVHDEIMPKMEVIYKLKEGIEEKISNTPDLSGQRVKKLGQVVSNMDSANSSMLGWMQKFSPLPDSVDQEQARAYLLAELDKVKMVKVLIEQAIVDAEAELNKKEIRSFKKATDKTAIVAKEIEPIQTTISPVSPVVISPVIEEKPKKDSSISKPAVIIDSSAIKKSIAKPTEKKPAGKPFYFNMINAETGNKVTGEVQVFEAKATHYLAIKSNELVYIVPPKNKVGIYQVNIQAPGYRPVKLAFNYTDPSPVVSGVGDQQEAIMTFELVRAKKGDYIDFNDVRFFRNSTILEPQSKNELNGLVDLLNESPKYKIKIHGHCNGDESRAIITLGNSTNNFELDPAHNKKETATPKRLTELRAETVKNYLVGQGIDPERIATKGEAGKMMIFPRTSTLANRNDRVEIEVLKSR
ncbi:MAG: OmpA family protein [Bacteroidota bacterium]